MRVWAPALAYVASLFTVLLLGPLGGSDTLLTAGVPIGAGIAVALLGGGGYLVRAFWLVLGVLFGALGYVTGGLVMPDTPLGLVIGGSIPVLLLAVVAMWTRRQSYFVAALLGMGALTGVFAVRFDGDPQGINTSLPIALGQTLLPMGIGYIAGMVAALSVDDDSYFAQRAQRKLQRKQAGQQVTEDRAESPEDDQLVAGTES